MGLTSWIKQLVKRSPASSPGLLTTVWQDGREVLRPGSFTSQIEANKHWVYVCAQKNAAAVAASRLRLYVAKDSKVRSLVKTAPVGIGRKDYLALNPGLKEVARQGLDIEEVEEHPFLDLMKKANPFTGRFTLLETTELFLELTGNAYWHVVGNRLGLPAEVWVIPAQYMSVKGSKKDFISGYTCRAGSETVDLTPAEVVHFKFPNPANAYYGRSPLMAVADTYNVFENMQDFENALFSNMARPEGVLTTDQSLGRTEVELLRQMWNERHSGAGKAGKVAVLASGLKYQNITLSPRELSFLAGRKMSREEICAAYGVPQSKVTAENVNLANARVGEEQYQRDAIRPRLWRIEEKLNKDLVARWAPNIFAAFDDPVPSDREFELRRVETGLSLGFMTVNEARKREGLGPVAWGDESGASKRREG